VVIAEAFEGSSITTVTIHRVEKTSAAFAPHQPRQTLDAGQFGGSVYGLPPDHGLAKIACKSHPTCATDPFAKNRGLRKCLVRHLTSGTKFAVFFQQWSYSDQQQSCPDTVEKVASYWVI